MPGPDPNVHPCSGSHDHAPAVQTARPASPKKSRLWLWFVAAFALQAVAWAAWFVIAAKHPVEQVPLATGR